MKRLLFAMRYILSGRLLSARRDTAGTFAPVTITNFIVQKVLGVNRAAHWPVSPLSKVTGCENIKIGIGCAPGLSPFCYIQGINGINIGDYTAIGPGVKIISANHDPLDTAKHLSGSAIEIGKYCWIGANAVILPEVHLGDHTIVAAGAVVNRSFEAGYCVVAGVPARVVKRFDHSAVKESTNAVPYIGYCEVKK